MTHPTMQPRLDYRQASPKGVQAMFQLERAIRESGLEPKLLELIKTRASQINGCAYCIDMRTKDARAHGGTEQRLFALSAWREAPFYTEKERAALSGPRLSQISSVATQPTMCLRRLESTSRMRS